MSRDSDYVEKRLDKPGALRAAVTYTIVVVALAAVAFAFYAFGARDSVYAATLVPLFLFVGGVGAFVKTYREWKAERGWAAWQGAGWFLMSLMLVSLAIPGMAIMAGAVK
ncbi:hypothetical protein Mycch_0322 [Mycolicibacterium chubuense NBB4]|uniref:Transmembrane protein n=1 Tax=Mycolicibacterium chubuense (strain NBB4) TaxID=710421 RepID=I4BCY9_MYCCN|nr:hypothetical protein [Mycolicibacterium chubuense]AFM15146.1 hypothetical protein Mycch_0322 [Mycolicibacterium chubuense NBB4]